MSDVRKAAVAGTWYPGSAAALAAAVDGHLADADRLGATLERTSSSRSSRRMPG